jgi:hypothetical protein
LIAGLVTGTRVPKGCVRWPTANASTETRSPLEICRSSYAFPYEVAKPACVQRALEASKFNMGSSRRPEEGNPSGGW